MLETPAQHDVQPGRDRLGAPQRYGGAESLRRFSWHTGAPLRPLHPDERCPVLFRDLGPVATAHFLGGTLERLAGPFSPILYTRTEAWPEPYTDHGAIGRLLFLRPLTLGVWHSGVEHVFVARASRTVAADTAVYVPGHLSLVEAAGLGESMSDGRQWREALGGEVYDDIVEDARARLDALEREQTEAERLGEPLRSCLQMPDPRSREGARALLERVGMHEHDLCAAWHHIEAGRRRWIIEALGSLEAELAALTARVPEPLRRRYQVGR